MSLPIHRLDTRGDAAGLWRNASCALAARCIHVQVDPVAASNRSVASVRGPPSQHPNEGRIMRILAAALGALLISTSQPALALGEQEQGELAQTEARQTEPQQAEAPAAETAEAPQPAAQQADTQPAEAAQPATQQPATQEAEAKPAEAPQAATTQQAETQPAE